MSTFKVTSESYPTLHKAFNMISHDSGGRAGHESFDAPESFRADCDRAEPLLRRLKPESLEIVCIGDMEESDRILQAWDDDGSAERVLAKFFTDWK